MALSRSRKEETVTSLREEISGAKTIVFVRFSRVTAEEAHRLRTACDGAGARYVVAKKTLIRKVFEGADIAGDYPDMEGEIAVALSGDMLAAPRVMGEQSEALDGRLSIVGGVFEGTFVPEERMRAIADIPPIKTLYAQFLMVIRSPIQGIVSALDQIAEKK